jgi:hypothetical protein
MQLMTVLIKSLYQFYDSWKIQVMSMAHSCACLSALDVSPFHSRDDAE